MIYAPGLREFLLCWSIEGRCGVATAVGQRLVDTMTKAHDNASIGQHAKLICRLPAKGFGTTEFDMPKTKIEALLEAGRIAMRSHLAAPKHNIAAVG